MADRFEEIVQGILELHRKKAQDYGSDGDQYANVRASQEFGIEPWVGAALRLNDKVQRLKSMVQKGRLVNESILDSFDDVAVYAVIARVLYEESQEGLKKPTSVVNHEYEHERGMHENCDVFACTLCADRDNAARAQLALTNTP